VLWEMLCCSTCCAVAQQQQQQQQQQQCWCVCVSAKDLCVAGVEGHWVYEALHVDVDDRLKLLTRLTVPLVLRPVPLQALHGATQQEAAGGRRSNRRRRETQEGGRQWQVKAEHNKPAVVQLWRCRYRNERLV